MEKKPHDGSPTETPSAWRESSATKDGRSHAGDGMDGMQSGLRDMIARRAYELYEERGCADGDDLDDWLRAEAEVGASMGGPNKGMIEMAKRRRQSVAAGNRGE